jgi:ABC-type nitrate/sulfonate/bicarbonate transport system substrate-binding protein
MKKFRMRKSALALAVTSLVAALALVPGAIGGKQATTKVNICYANAATDFAQLLAASKESWAGPAEGLDINLVLALGTGPQLLGNNTCQIGIGSGPEHMLHYANGVDFALVGGWQNRFGFKLLVRTDRGINKPADLKGHKIGVSTIGGPPDQSARLLLKNLKLVADKDVGIVYIPNITSRLAALQQGSLDAAIFSPPVKQITAGGRVKDILDLSYLRFISLGVWTKRDFAEKNPDVIKGFFRAIVKTNAWFLQPANKPQVLAHIRGITGISDPAGLEEAYSYTILGHLPREPVIDRVALRNSIEYVKDQYGKTVNADDFTYFKPLEQVLTYTVSASPKGGSAKAAFSGALRQNGQFTWRLSSNGLSGAPTAVTLHVAAAGKTGPTRLSLCRKCKASQSGTIKVGTGLARAIKDGRAYVNVRTAKKPNGEIRGQIAAALGR